ncbi:MAG TPA: transglycosylase SLT domain-containing protein [Thermoanaerobaculia bacterium]|nr:transglycosylase SLT domain-containing protein [Thermoanaerobaculia bacterium]
MKRTSLALIVVVGTGFAAACGQTRTTSTPLVVRPAALPPAAPADISAVREAQGAGNWESAEAGLRGLAISPDPQTRSRAIAMLGLLYLEKDRPQEAASSLATAIGASPTLAPVLRLRLMTAQQKLGKPLEAIATGQQILAESPTSSAARTAQVRLPGLYALAGDRTNATAQLQMLESVEIDEYTEADLVSTAGLLDSAGMKDLATQLRLRILRKYPQGRYTEKTYGNLQAGEGAPLDQLTYEDSAALADRIGKVNRYDQAIDLLERIARRFPDKASSGALRALRARSFFNTRRYDSVIAENFTTADDNYVAMQFLRARAFWRTDRNSEFLRILDEIITKYPASPEATAAKLQLGKYYVTDEMNSDKAISYLTQAVDAGAAGEQGENLWTLGWTYTVAKKDSEALATYDKYLKAFPNSDYATNSLFWSGKIHARNNDNAKRDASFNRLIQLYPYSYYAYRAREILGMPPGAGVPQDVASSFPDLGISMPDHEAGLALVAELLQIGMQREAAAEVRLLAARDPSNLTLAYRLAELYSEAGQTMGANSLLQRRFREQIRRGAPGAPKKFWEMVFPLPYGDVLWPAAEKYNVDPYLIASVIRQESGFDPTVVSSAGAVGLMQLMPAEATRIATLGNITPPSREDLFNPSINITMGAAELRQKIDALNGRETLAIAAYNAGETPVNRWLARTPTDDIDIFIESIPYAETKLYVKNVTRNRNEYRRIYGVRPPSPARVQ